MAHSSPFDFNHTGSVSSGLVALLGYFTNTEVAATPNITLPQFSPALGRLNSATVTVATTTRTFAVTPTGLLSLLSGGSATRNLAYVVTAGATTGGQASEVVSTGGALLTLLNIGGGEIGGATAPANTGFATSADLRNLTGSSTFTVKLTATNKLEIFTLLSLFNGAGMTASGRYAGTVSVTYDYTPWSLTGRVYRDLDHSGFRGANELGTGLSLYAKLVSESTPAGPATQVVPADPTTGLYSLGVAFGTYRIIIDDNTSLADVTPVVPPAGWNATLPSPPERRSVVVLGDLSGQDFGLIQATLACGRLFKDDGAGAGVANDGVFNGAEAGLAGQSVRLLDVNSAVLDSAVSGGTGTYCLYVPSTISGGAALRILHQRGPAFLATGATLGNSGGSYTRAQDTIALSFVSALNYANLNFGTVPVPTLTGNGHQSGSASAVLWFSHRFRSSSVGQATFTVSHAASPAIATLPTILYLDSNDNGSFDPGEPPVSGPIPLVVGSNISLLLKVTIPAAAPYNASTQVALRADMGFTNAAPALVHTLTSNDLVDVMAANGGAIVLTKTVDKSTAVPGATLVYMITFTNNGTAAITNLVIDDATPTYTSFQATSAVSLPAGLGVMSATTPTAGAKGTLKWTFAGQLLPSAIGTIQFSVVIDP